MSELIKHAEGLWTISAPHQFFRLQLGTRMTVVRLPDGGLWLHSVVAIGDVLAGQLEALGPVRHIVIPNLYHHVYVAAASHRWPGAAVHAPAAMGRKRPELPIHSELSETPDPGWGGVLVPVHIDGSWLDETVFVHVPSRTLICADLVENFQTSRHLPTRLYLKLSKLEGRVGLDLLCRLSYRNHRAARQSLQRLLRLEFERVVLAHGQVLEHGGPSVVRDAFRWLTSSD